MQFGENIVLLKKILKSLKSETFFLAWNLKMNFGENF